MLWLTDQSQTESAVATLERHENILGEGEIFAGPSLTLQFNDPLTDSRTPDIIVAPNIGVIYTGGKKKVSEHGGFAYDDRNVLLIVSNPAYRPSPGERSTDPDAKTEQKPEPAPAVAR